MINHNGKEYKKRMYIHITELLCCIAEMNTTLEINYTSIKNVLKKSKIHNLQCLHSWGETGSVTVDGGEKSKLASRGLICSYLNSSLAHHAQWRSLLTLVPQFSLPMKWVGQERTTSFFFAGALVFFFFVVGFVIHWNESAMDIHVFPISIPPPTSLSTRSLWVFPVHQVRVFVSCIPPGLVICFTLDNIHVSMLFSWNIPPSPSPRVQSLFYTRTIFCRKSEEDGKQN